MMDAGSLVLVARIIKPHGIHGEVVLESWTDVEGRLENTPVFFLTDPEGNVLREVTTESRRWIQGRPVFRFTGIPTRTEAEHLRNLELAIPEDQLGELPEGKYFVFQLIGMDVVGLDGSKIGVVRNIIHTVAGDVLEMEDRKMIPFIDGICVDVDVKNRRIVIDPPEGLIEPAGK